MKKRNPVRFAALLLAALVLVCAFPFRSHASDPAYSVCSVCLGTGICGNCNPYNTMDTMMPASDKLGDGWIRCGFCDADGYRKCGTNADRLRRKREDHMRHLSGNGHQQRRALPQL